jgi:regulatory protein
MMTIKQSRKDGPKQHYRAAHNRALKMLSYKSRSVFEITSDLEKKGFPHEIVGSVVDNLLEKGWLDDHAFARDIVQFGQKSNKGWARIYNDLRKRGIDRHQAEEALMDFYEPEAELEAIKRLANESLAPYTAFPDKSIIYKIMIRITRKGFSPSKVKCIIDDLTWERYREGFLDTDSHLS